MSVRRLRFGLLLSLALLIASSFAFYVRQNQGHQWGGEISVPKMIWLTTAIAAWFVVPGFLWMDQRLGDRVRRLFGVFWVMMWIRGVAELVLIYGFRHWSPWYGISHDLLCLGTVFALRARCSSASEVDRAALRLSGTIALSLLAEAAFAGMFLATGEHEKGVYFASASPSWTLVNYLTWMVLAFVVPDSLMALTQLHVTTGRRSLPAVLRWGRIAAGAMVSVGVVAGLTLWLWMAHYENHARRFQDVGYDVVDSCVRFRGDFMNRDVDAMKEFARAPAVRWTARTLEGHGHDVVVQRWAAEGEARSLSDAFLAMRDALPDLEESTFKIHLIDEVGDDFVVGQLRFEITGRSGTDSGLIRCRFELAEGRWCVVAADLIEGLSVRATARTPRFDDRAIDRGLDFVMEQDARFTPGESCTEHDCWGPTELRFQTMRHAYAGCAAADYDGDGHDDVFLAAGGRARLFRNRGQGEFEEVTDRVGLGALWHVNTAGFADLDNDGDQDLFLGRFFGANSLFENRGDGTFVDRTKESGLARDDQVTCFAFFDYDRDGDLDLYLGRFLDASAAIPDSFLYARNGQPNRLYRNDGELRFRDVTAEAGVGDRGLALSLAAADYDDDGDQDLYVANDFGRNVLFQNQGDGTFRDVAKEAGALAIGGSMSASWGDYDNDGRLDLYVAAIRSNQRWFVQPITARRVVLKFLREGKLGSDNPILSDLQEYMGPEWVEIGNHALAGNSLLRQRQGGVFEDVAERAGARPAGWYWGSGFADVDHDGDLDILATDGWITGKNSHDL